MSALKTMYNMNICIFTDFTDISEMENALLIMISSALRHCVYNKTFVYVSSRHAFVITPLY